MSDDAPQPRHDLEDSDPDDQIHFTPDVLDRTVIAIPLLKEMRKEREATLTGRGPSTPKLYHVVIDLNLAYHGGREEANGRVHDLGRGVAGDDPDPVVASTSQYVFARLTAEQLQEVVRRDEEGRQPDDRAVYRIWPDFPIKPLINHSVSTVKADAARASFAAVGTDVVWAVLDSGIQGDHPHFLAHANLEKLPGPVQHVDFTGSADGPLVDRFGHGTHVAGIIAGEQLAPKKGPELLALSRKRDDSGAITFDTVELPAMSGMAPRAKLVSMKVLDERGEGRASSLIAAIDKIQEINGYGRRLRIHGVNMSVGYDFEPEWFACGQSPLCVEVDRLVRSGVVVVVAAGNTGYGKQQTQFRSMVAAGLPLSINDPGNAELAITVGSTHRDMPHVYGVSYFSSKGPTGDGRPKPDLVAPGEKILSCAAGSALSDLVNKATAAANARRQPPPLPAGARCDYLEQSGTSMAAPHVSGVIAAFLSIRKEFQGQPEKVKEIFLATATDLRRDRYFQGSGLVDLMRAIQSV